MYVRRMPPLDELSHNDRICTYIYVCGYTYTLVWSFDARMLFCRELAASCLIRVYGGWWCVTTLRNAHAGRVRFLDFPPTRRDSIRFLRVSELRFREHHANIGEFSEDFCMFQCLCACSNCYLWKAWWKSIIRMKYIRENQRCVSESRWLDYNDCVFFKGRFVK